ncbi:phenylalanine--tRNA ligase beta subunit-related protein [Limibacter armeniacum]|uniref:B3/B4 domain-containing protein n=1 Tax=Limibacter armeniacum TaxID=466084 RepID=UPI002FE55565
MIKTVISPTIKAACPNIKLGIITAEVQIEESSLALKQEIQQTTSLLSEITAEEVRNHPVIKASKSAYKSLGKDPNRYRLSAEALMRRMVKSQDLYLINNMVDIINLTSLRSGFSIGGYDLDMIKGEVELDHGKADVAYQAIGRGVLNIEFLPVLHDHEGAFGSPTSDSVRTSIGDGCQQVALFFFDFEPEGLLDDALSEITQLMTAFAGAKNIQQVII